MKHLLFLIVAAAVYLHFYPNEEVTKFYNEQKTAAQSMFSDFSDTKIRLKADKVYTDLENKLDRFSDKEVQHLKEITASRDDVKLYYFTICKTEKRDIIFHINNEQLVCNTISKYTNLL
ncbi:hypothetical protein [Colwellia sp. E2M01]|uniref:hypothetical protein n=1 Tax=Colwellia sp. E2M01 TaxID=2841561 RepID=UPI001C098FC5|nr:hypothetical protein [Colwellia sp. E2M01]MBU2870118.1 hypothetical protein [Colwellia sp. E2M01]